MPSPASSANNDAQSSVTGAELEFDGACSGNPGPAAYGFVLRTDDSIITGSDNIGEATNNKAEYAGLIAGLQHAQAEGLMSVLVQGDSQLVIRQMTGEYRVNADSLRPLHRKASRTAEAFDDIQFEWVKRENNSRADELARSALDAYS